jgi:hypothetical protein
MPIPREQEVPEAAKHSQGEGAETLRPDAPAGTSSVKLVSSSLGSKVALQEGQSARDQAGSLAATSQPSENMLTSRAQSEGPVTAVQGGVQGRSGSQRGTTTSLRGLAQQGSFASLSSGGVSGERLPALEAEIHQLRQRLSLALRVCPTYPSLKPSPLPPFPLSPCPEFCRGTKPRCPVAMNCHLN